MAGWIKPKFRRDLFCLLNKFRHRKNKHMAKNNTVWIILAVVVGGYFLMQGGMLDGLFGASEPTDSLYPSDLKTTITLNTQNGLATTAEEANVSYYVFTSGGDYLKEGSTSSGTASFTVPTGGHYKLISYKDDGTSDFLVEELTFSTDGDDPTKRAVQTINLELDKECGATIDAVQDPVDLDDMAAASAGATVKFNLLISANNSNSALNKPVIAFYANSSTVDEVNFAGLTESNCPDRLSAATGFRYICFPTQNRIYSSDGIVTFSGTVLIDKTNEPTGEDSANDTIYILDTGVYPNPNYKTAGYSAFVFDKAENENDNSDIGADDSDGKAFHMT